MPSPRAAGARSSRLRYNRNMKHKVLVTLWTPQAGYAVAVLVACLWWGASIPPQHPTRPEQGLPTAARTVPGALAIPAAQTNCPPCNEDLPDDSLPAEGAPQDGSNTTANKPTPKAILPVASPPIIRQVIY